MTRELYQVFSDLLSYPGADLPDTARRGAQAARFAPQAAEALASFAELARESGAESMQELYTATFDLQPLCAPYVGYHLLGEDARRGRFLMKLQEIYRKNGIVQRPEMADHLGHVLHFIAAAPECAERAALVSDGLRPALDKMVAAFAEGDNPYGRLIGALRTCLETQAPSPALRTPKEVAHA